MFAAMSTAPGILPSLQAFSNVASRDDIVKYANDHQRNFEIPDRTGPVNQVRSLWGTHEPLYQFCHCRRNRKFNSEVDSGCHKCKYFKAMRSFGISTHAGSDESNENWCLATLRGSHSTEVCDDLDFLSVVSTRTLHMPAPPLSCESLADNRKMH